MGDRAAPRVDVSIGDVENSQLVIGDHNTVQTPAGTRVTVLQVGEKPVPKLRPQPVSRRPSAAAILGREEELALIAAADAGEPMQLYGPDGAGKTSLLKLAAQRTSAPTEGVVFEPARHRSLDEIQAALYAAFWECETPFVPAPSEFAGFLADRRALLLIDDCGLDRSELETLLDRLPGCTVVLASQARSLWSRGTALGLPDLDQAAAVGLLERELGGALGPDERQAAEAVVARLGGNPQSLVETAALVADGRSSLRELADDPAALERRFDPSALTDSQRRILAVLATLDGAALGVEHVTAVTGVGDAEQELRELERRGWVKAGSPRYRSTRELSPDVGSQAGSVGPLLERLTSWSQKAEPKAVAEEAEAIERVVELGGATRRWNEALDLSLAAERGLTVAGAWSSSRRVLQAGLRAAAEVGGESAHAFLLHQLGSQSLCLGDRAGAVEQLSEALEIRERLGEKEAAELTRHNLGQLGGGGWDGGGGDGGGKPPRPRMAIALTSLAVVVAGIVAALLLAGGDERNIAGTDPVRPTTEPTTTPTDTVPPPTDPEGTRDGNPPADEGPTITIYSPGDEDVFKEGGAPDAVYECVAADGTQIEPCEGFIDGRGINNGSVLDGHPGSHTLEVIAIDADGRSWSETVTYTVEAAEPPPADNGDTTEGEVVETGKAGVKEPDHDESETKELEIEEVE